MSSSAVVQKLHVWSGDCLSLASRLAETGLRFDVMHTSNVIDYAGLLSLAEAYSPLLRGPGASLECEVMMGVANTFDEFARQALGVSAATLKPLLAVLHTEDFGVNGAMLLRFRQRRPEDELLGSTVRIRDLAARPELNGQTATVLSFDGKSGRFALAICDGSANGSGAKLSVKPEKIQPQASPCTASETATVRELLEAIVGRERAVMSRGLHHALSNGRGIPAHTVNSLVGSYVLWCRRSPRVAPLPLDACLDGTVGTASLRQHRLALQISAALHGGGSSSCPAFGHLATPSVAPTPSVAATPSMRTRPLLTAKELSWHTWQLSLLSAAQGDELSLVALLLSAPALRILQQAGVGASLERRVRETSPSELQVVDSVHFEPRAAVLRLLLPSLTRLQSFFAERAAPLQLVLLDVQNWRLISQAMQALSAMDEQD